MATLTTREPAGLWHLVQAADDVALIERTTARRFLPLPETVADGARLGVAEDGVAHTAAYHRYRVSARAARDYDGFPTILVVTHGPRACYEPFELSPISKSMDPSPKAAPNRPSETPLRPAFEMREMPEVHNML